MNTLEILGTALGSAAVIGGAVWAFKKYFPGEDISKKLFQYLNKTYYNNVIEVEELSLRTYGAWMKTLDLPSYDGYHFFVIKVPISKLPKKYSDRKDDFGDYAYAFVVTNNTTSKVVSSQLTVSSVIEKRFDEKIVEEVTEIKL